MINEAIRAIIDLLKLKKDAKKADLEIEKLEREKAKARSLIEIASVDDIKKYDPRIKEVERIAQQHEREARYRHAPPMKNLSRPGGWLRWLIVAALIAYGLYRCAS